MPELSGGILTIPNRPTWNNVFIETKTATPDCMKKKGLVITSFITVAALKKLVKIYLNICLPHFE